MSCNIGQTQTAAIDTSIDHIVKIEMNLSAFGVESDDFPSIDAVVEEAQALTARGF